MVLKNYYLLVSVVFAASGFSVTRTTTAFTARPALTRRPTSSFPMENYHVIMPRHNNNNNNNNNKNILYSTMKANNDDSAKDDSIISVNAFKTTCLAVSLSLIVLLSPVFTASAAVTEFNPFIYNNQYDDPLHPQCRREIQVAADGKTFHYQGTAVGDKDDPVNRGCSQVEIRKYKLRTGEFDGAILEDGRISAGDGIHEGIWEPAGTAPIYQTNYDKDGIRWNDGNKWAVHVKPLSQTVGEFIFLSYIGFSTLAGMKGLYDGIQRKRREAEDQLV